VDRIDPNEHAVNLQKLLAHLIHNLVGVNRRLGIDAKRAQLFEDPMKSVVPGSRGPPGFTITPPEDGDSVARRIGRFTSLNCLASKRRGSACGRLVSLKHRALGISTKCGAVNLWTCRKGHKGGLCQLSRRLIDDVSAILPRAQAVSMMPSAIAALRMCCQRRVAAGTRWRMRDLQRRKFRSSSWPRQYRLADPVLFNPSIGRHRPLMPR